MFVRSSRTVGIYNLLEKYAFWYCNHSVKVMVLTILGSNPRLFNIIRGDSLMVKLTAHNRKNVSSNLTLLIKKNFFNLMRISVIGMHMRLMISKRLFKSIIRKRSHHLMVRIWYLHYQYVRSNRTEIIYKYI